MGKRAESTLPKIRDWMNANSWIVNEAVLLFLRDGAVLGGRANLKAEGCRHSQPDVAPDH
jgi:hypothetical protein